MVDKKGDNSDGSYFIEYESFDKVSTEHSSKGIKDTMFPNHYDLSIRQELTKCLRVFPHD